MKSVSLADFMFRLKYHLRSRIFFPVILCETNLSDIPGSMCQKTLNCFKYWYLIKGRVNPESIFGESIRFDCDKTVIMTSLKHHLQCHELQPGFGDRRPLVPRITFHVCHLTSNIVYHSHRRITIAALLLFISL